MGINTSRNLWARSRTCCRRRINIAVRRAHALSGAATTLDTNQLFQTPLSQIVTLILRIAGHSSLLFKKFGIWVARAKIRGNKPPYQVFKRLPIFKPSVKDSNPRHGRPQSSLYTALAYLN